MSTINDPIEDWIKNGRPLRWKKRPEVPKAPEPVVKLVVSNPDVPLERQRERLSEAHQRLVADEERRLRELEAAQRQERLIAERQAALEWHMEMVRANQEAERRMRAWELNPFNVGGVPSFHRGQGED